MGCSALRVQKPCAILAKRAGTLTIVRFQFTNTALFGCLRNNFDMPIVELFSMGVQFGETPLYESGADTSVHFDHWGTCHNRFYRNGGVDAITV